MSRSMFENGVSYYDITRKIEEYTDRHVELDSKQEQEDNLLELLLYTMEFPEYMNFYDEIRETILENIRSNYERLGKDPDFLTACSGWLEMFADA
jgi:hypothetical protein